uniref:hypothetical protein n=1 Tax=uncultured Rhizobium sp. TaxID=155567 RepID=UPI002617C95F
MVQNTNIRIHFQPLIVWLDASLINKLQKLSAVIGHGHNNVKTNAIPTEIVLTRSSVQLDIHIPSLRFLATAPHSPVSQLLKNHILCVDISNSIESMHVPLFKLKLPDSVLNQSDPACVCSVNLAFRRSTFYLVSPSVSLEGSVKQADLSFKAQDFLNVSLDSSKLATVEMLLRSKTSGGARLAEQAWIGVTEQQKGGTGGRKTNPEFAAATATEAVDAKNERIREDVRKFSST